MRNENILLYFAILSQYFPGRFEQNYKIFVIWYFSMLRSRAGVDKILTIRQLVHLSISTTVSGSLLGTKQLFC